MKLKTFLTIFAFFLYSEASFAQGMEGHTVVDPTSGGASEASTATAANPSPTAGAGQAAGNPAFKDCTDAYYNIETKCSDNTRLAAQNAKLPNIQKTLNGAQANGAGENQEAVIQIATPARAAYQAILGECQQAAKSCKSLCRRQKRQAEVNPSPDSPVLISNAEKAINLCTNEEQAVTQKATAQIMDLEKIIKAASAALELLKGLKGGSGSDVALSDSDDPCEKYNGTGILVGQCGNETGSTASRATGGLTGVGAAGLTSSDDGLIQSASMGKAGGDGLGKKSASGTFNPSSSGGMSGFGFGGGVGSDTAAGVAGEDKLDTDIHKGFLSADGGGGGFSSGGGSSGSVRPFGRGTSDDGSSGTLQKAALNRKLSRYANSEKRGLASTGDKNGPFQDNWTIIKKAYKNNSNTMFHQK